MGSSTKKNAAPTFSVLKKKLWLDIFCKMLKNKKTRGGYPFLASPSKKIASHAKGGNIVDTNAK